MISDLHLGGLCTRTPELRAFLQRLPETRRLILNGDTLDADAVALPDEEVLVLDRLAELNRTFDSTTVIGTDAITGEKVVGGVMVGCQVTLVGGNHDPHIERWAPLLGLADVDVQDEVVVESGGKRFLVTHGHQWDPLVNKSSWFHGLGAWCSRWIARWVSVRAGRWVRYMTSKRAANNVLEGATNRAYELGCYAAICGHTHKPEERGSIKITVPTYPVYCNEGSWCENVPPTWAEIEGGEVRLRTWEPGTGRQLR